ncbi:MAG TPA: penicillin-binding protein 2 [Gemmatimonadaceae bacterium]|nr:penicillin-binding protein 2 [Gemmatimonadaceae bacterium]
MIRSRRIGLTHALLAVFALAVIGRAARLQLLQRQAWRARAERQQLSAREIPAPRGRILDAAGLVLAQSRDMVQLEIAPREVRNAAALRGALARAGVPREWIARALDRRRAWVTLPGRFVAVDVAGATALRGVYATTASVRTYTMSEGTRRLVGRVDSQDRALDGLELSLDSLLRGRPGSATFVRDLHGRRIESPAAPSVPPQPGNTVVLTLNHDLQEIAERALGEAVATMNAEGGDIVILDPHDGDVLAMASRRADPRSTAATALTEPFEPGSTMKPFIAAGLLERGRARETDVVNTGNGVLELQGRVIHDEEALGRATLAQVLQYSSNVGIVTFASRLSPREEFETLRDFGFGTVTGVPYPSESNGVLREPSRWSAQSPASLAMGYEISVTPLQLALAYATFANGGKLLEPALVKEVRAPDGRVLYHRTPRLVRQVLTPDVADRVRRMLLNVVDGGTALRADLNSYLLAGKTGTPRRTVNGRYASQQYNPNFVGLFPGDAPQYVIVVKLTNPRDSAGRYVSGATAAPLTKTVLQAAIAARDAALDRLQLASSAAVARAESTGRADSTSPITRGEHLRSAPVVAAAASTPPRDAWAADPGVSYVVHLAHRPEGAPRVAPPRPVPDVRGMDLRDAVRSLHGAGFRVQLGRGPTGTTTPAAGTLAYSGTLVRLAFDY